MSITTEFYTPIVVKIRDQIRSLILDNAFFQTELNDSDNVNADINGTVVYKHNFLRKLPLVNSNNVSISVHHNNLERITGVKTDIFQDARAFFYVDILINNQDPITNSDLQEYYKKAVLISTLHDENLNGLVKSWSYIGSEPISLGKAKLNNELLRLTFECFYNIKFLVRS